MATRVAMAEEPEKEADPWNLHSSPEEQKALVVGRAGEDAKRAGNARVPDLDVGDQLTVTVGKETFSPVRYHTFEVGPVMVAGHVRPGETAVDAFTRLYESATVLFATEFEVKCRQHLGRVRKAHEFSEQQRGRGKDE